MCLLIHVDRTDSPVSPRTFYKVILANRGSLYFNTKYPVGGIVKATGLLWTDRAKQKGQINAGAIHVYTSGVTASHRASLFTAMTGEPTLVIKVKCLPEHFIAWGYEEEAAYTQVEVLD